MNNLANTGRRGAELAPAEPTKVIFLFARGPDRYGRGTVRQ